MVAVIYDGVGLNSILQEKHDSNVVLRDIILAIQYVGVVASDAVVENVLLSADSTF
jgi:hypothetical protein